MLAALRLHMAEALDIPREGHALLWVVNFPMFHYDEDEGKYSAEHHPFTHVLEEDLDKIESHPLACGSYSYDLVMDGFEVGGGTIRIHDAEEQKRILKVCGLTDEEIEERNSVTSSMRSSLARRLMVASRSASTAWSCCLPTNNPFVTLSRSRRPLLLPIQ